MTPNRQRMLISLAATVLGALYVIPEFGALYPIVAKLCGPVAGLLGGWAHMEKPGSRVSGVPKEPK